MTELLDLTGGRLDVRVNQGDGEGFLVPLPADLTAWSVTTTGGIVVQMQPTRMIVRIPAAVTAALTHRVAYSIRVAPPAGEPTTLLSGSILP